jgi:hypothetical protein
MRDGEPAGFASFAPLFFCVFAAGFFMAVSFTVASYPAGARCNT